MLGRIEITFIQALVQHVSHISMSNFKHIKFYEWRTNENENWFKIQLLYVLARLIRLVFFKVIQLLSN